MNQIRPWAVDGEHTGSIVREFPLAVRLISHRGVAFSMIAAHELVANPDPFGGRSE